VQTPLVQEKPAVMTVSGCGVAEAGGVVEAWSVNVGCGPVGVAGAPVGEGVRRDPWSAETEYGTRSKSSSKLAATIAMSTFFITTSSKV
jgi:hypothetical protein